MGRPWRPGLDYPFSVVWDRSRSIMSVTNTMSFWTVDFHLSLTTNTLLRIVDFIPFDQLRTFIPCGQSTFANDHPLCDFRTVTVRPSTFADRSLLVTLVPVQTRWSMGHGLSTLIGLGIDQKDQNK